MADYTIASRVGQGGGGQNALAGGVGFNPNTMFQLMQMKQTMELQRLAEQRAAAAEGRAAALHAPALEAANLRVKEARLGLGRAEEEDIDRRDAKARSDKYFSLIGQNLDPADPAVIDSFKTTDPKFYADLTQRKLTQDAAKIAGRKTTIETLQAEHKYFKDTADLALSNFDRVTDQNTYSKIYNDIISVKPSLAGVLPAEYSPENAERLKRTLESVQDTNIVDLGDGIKALKQGKTIKGLIDPTKPETNYIDSSPQALQALSALSPTAPTGAQPRAAAPQTMQFSGMGQLAPAGQQAAQAVMSAFPGARITSGYRSPQKNTDVGGAPRSYHLTGNAIDVVPPAGMPMNVFAAQLQAQLGPMGYTVMYGDPGHLDHVHIQPGNAMNVPRAFSPSVAATDVAAGREPTGMMAPANAMAPLAAMALMQQQNALAAQQQQPQPQPDIAPALTAAAAPAAGIGMPAPPAPTVAPTTVPEAGAEGRPVRGANEPWAVYNKRVAEWEKGKPKSLSAEQEFSIRKKVGDDQGAAKSAIFKMDDVLSTIDELRKFSDDDKERVLGVVYGRTPPITKKAKDVQRVLDNLIGKLTDLGKTEAAQSGAIGSMAVPEWKLMRDFIVAMDPTKLDAKGLNEQLAKVEAYAKSLKNRTRETYENTYKEEINKYGERFKLPSEEAPASRGKAGEMPRQLAPQDQQALDWANANPRDPRAAQIKQRLGVD